MSTRRRSPRPPLGLRLAPDNVLHVLDGRAATMLTTLSILPTSLDQHVPQVFTVGVPGGICGVSAPPFGSSNALSGSKQPGTVIVCSPLSLSDPGEMGLSYAQFRPDSGEGTLCPVPRSAHWRTRTRPRGKNDRAGLKPWSSSTSRACLSLARCKKRRNAYTPQTGFLAVRRVWIGSSVLRQANWASSKGAARTLETSGRPPFQRYLCWLVPCAVHSPHQAQ